VFAIAVAMMKWRGELQKTLGFSSSITHREVGLNLSGSDEKKLRHQLYGILWFEISYVAERTELAARGVSLPLVYSLVPMCQPHR
jgi:hypothetical protein